MSQSFTTIIDEDTNSICQVRTAQGSLIDVKLVMDHQDGTGTFEDKDGNRYRRYWRTEVRYLQFW